MTLKVLFIGGTGVISSACSKLALDQGFDLHLLTRGKSIRSIPPGARVITGDINNSQALPDITDLVMLVSFMFQQGEAPAPCPN